jgi:hypothetical protein
VPSPRWRARVAATAIVLLAIATPWFLDRFARARLADHLERSAAAALAMAATGASPYHWPFRSPSNLVSGRPFGAASFAFDDGELSFVVGPGSAEIGLPIRRYIDLRDFPVLRTTFDAAGAGGLRVVVSESPEAKPLVSMPSPFPGGASIDLAIDLAQIGWLRDGVPVATAPRRSVLLRVRFESATPIALRLRQVALEHATDYQPPVLSTPSGRADDVPHPVVALPADPSQVVATLAAADRESTYPLILALPHDERVEKQLAVRDVALRERPSAIVLGDDAIAQTFALARSRVDADPGASSRSPSRWLAVALFAVGCLLTRLRPPRRPRTRAVLEIALTLAVPMWIVFGGNTGTNLQAPHAVAAAVAAAFWVSLSFPRRWTWVGPAAAWWAAAGVIVLALLIGIVLFRSGASSHAPPDLRHLVRYLGWALLQQYLICAVCTERWSVASGHDALAAYLGALGFALLHAPNSALMLATFVGGLCWCAIYLRYRALLPLAFSHAASALLLIGLLPTDILHSAEVSARFFR